ncbi:MAG: AMP-binding protein [Gracilibacteraceae bacterium]|jgi:long-chain acyl-CoA synthetase|nr:AMP-binding protein [Gracilibacteraceae bacterium]
MYNVYSLFAIRAGLHPGHTALVFRERKISYAQLSAEINQTAYTLDRLDVRHGSRVAYLLPNDPRSVAAFYACQKLGAIAIPFNWRLKDTEMAAMVEECRCACFLYDPFFTNIIRTLREKFPQIEFFPYSEAETAMTTSDDLAARRPENENWEYYADPAAEAPAFYALSGGSTGKPKTIVHTQQSLVYVVLSRSGEYGFGQEDVFLNYAPLFHFGGINFMLGILSAATFILMESFNAEDVMQTIAAWRVSHLFIIPATLCSQIKRSPSFGRLDLSSVRCALIGGTVAFTSNLQDTFAVFTNPAFVVANGYGTTENGVTTMLTLKRQDLDGDSLLFQSLGKPVYMSQIRLVDQAGNEVPAGKVGEAYGRSPAQMKGYLGQPDVPTGGWIATGDLLRADEKGYYYFMDRKKDLVRTGGENVFSFEVEKALLTHPDVEDCAVFGIPHHALGEAIVAAVVCRKGVEIPSEDALIRHCKSEIASYKKPQKIYFVERLPRTAVGKTDKKELRSRYAEF